MFRFFLSFLKVVAYWVFTFLRGTPRTKKNSSRQLLLLKSCTLIIDRTQTHAFLFSYTRFEEVSAPDDGYVQFSKKIITLCIQFHQKSFHIQANRTQVYIYIHTHHSVSCTNIRRNICFYYTRRRIQLLLLQIFMYFLLNYSQPKLLFFVCPSCVWCT